MIQGNLDFGDPIDDNYEVDDTKYCIQCGKEEPKFNSYCAECDNSLRKERRDKYRKLNLDPNKTWDITYKKLCPKCKLTLNAEAYFDKKYSEKDGYNPKCITCEREYKQSIPTRYRSIKAGAKSRSLDFNISIEDTSGLLLSDCYYCGKPSKEGIKIHGLDRVDNSKGYHLDNVVTCCEQCNMAKHAYTQEEFIDMCKRVTERHTTYEKSNLEWIKVYLEDSGVGEISKENFIDPIW
jgi:5-methylcytosine-specific restriction endonuclease McrA